MNLFPVAIVKWREPATFWFSRRKPFTVVHAIIFLAIASIFGIRWWQTSGLGLLIFLVFGGAFSLAPWIHRRWPKLLPLTGDLVLLYKDRITRKVGKRSIGIMLDNIASCAYWNCKNDEGEYWALRFESKADQLGRIFGVLTETAIADSKIFEQVISVLRNHDIPVQQMSTEPPPLPNSR